MTITSAFTSANVGPATPNEPARAAAFFAARLEFQTDVSDVAIRDSLRLRRRKMQVAFGWDISCVLLTVGVWQPVELRREMRATLGALHFATAHLEPGHRRAIVRIAAGLDLFAAAPHEIEVAICIEQRRRMQTAGRVENILRGAKQFG